MSRRPSDSEILGGQNAPSLRLVFSSWCGSTWLGAAARDTALSIAIWTAVGAAGKGIPYL
ncbi:MAG TPA: hypothetical protein VKV74_09350 [Bryobacteraceae bacterium]|nr:hypothetical protein [Bryobacteraceae bacterium]